MAKELFIILRGQDGDLMAALCQGFGQPDSVHRQARIMGVIIGQGNQDTHKPDRLVYLNGLSRLSPGDQVTVKAGEVLPFLQETDDPKQA